MSEPNEATTAEPVEAAPAPDTTSDQKTAAQNTMPFWKRWLGKS